jgi:acetyltransferase-like isoleucine patch superfamily enzyme
LGELAIVNTHVAIGHDSVIGDSVQLAPFVCLAGNVKVGDRTFVGMGAMVLPGVTVGSDVVVGANSVVTNDVEDNAIVVGSPARPVKSPAS